MAKMPSGSRIERAAACAASAVLPSVANVGEPASAGTAVHAYVTDARARGRDSALGNVAPEYRELCEAIDLDGLPQEAALESEVALAYDVETEVSRLIGLNVGRNYGPLAPSEVAMSLDLAGVLGDVAYVADLKTGRGKVPPAHRNWQLRVGALALARLREVDLAKVAIIRSVDERMRYDVAQLDAMDLSMAADELRELWSRIVQAELDYEVGGAEAVRLTTGEHCRYCPSRIYCPAQTALVRRMAGEPQKVAEDIRILLTPETASLAYQRLKAVKDALKSVESALYAYASETPIDLGDGLVFGQTTVTREELDGAVAHDVLSELYGPEAAKVGCEFTTSKAAIDRAVRPTYERMKQKGEKVTIKGLVSEVLDAIQAGGGRKVTQRTEMREHHREGPAADGLPF